MKHHDERRSAPRKALHTRAKLTAMGRSVEVRTFDISTNGLGLYADFNPRPGLEVEVSLILITPGKEALPFVAQAKVTHSVFTSDGRGFKVGLSFTDVDPPSAYAVAAYVG